MSSSTLSDPTLASGVFTDTTPRDVAVSVRGLSKSYSIAHNAAKHTTAGEALMHRLRHPFAREERETFWALNDVSFDIQRGDVVGIIGRNGAGKSTLLKILSRITEPTTGQIDLYGRVGSLLEVGTGFHAELTGRENIFLNGAILGMSRAEIARQFDAIVDFSGTEQFLDTPVKRYSSGMYVRLAFAVAAHLNPEILIVDEVLAVGDAEFQKKCLGKMKEVSEGGRTVLFVSHNMEAVSKLCNKSLLMHNGSLAFNGAIQETVTQYLLLTQPQDNQDHLFKRRDGSGELRFDKVQSSKMFFEPDEEKTITFTVKQHRPFTSRYFVSGLIKDTTGQTLLQFDSRLIGYWITATEVFSGMVKIRHPWLKPGKYRIDLFLCTEGRIIDQHENAVSIQIAPMLPYSHAADAGATAYGVVHCDFDVSELISRKQEKVLLQ